MLSASTGSTAGEERRHQGEDPTPGLPQAVGPGPPRQALTLHVVVEGELLPSPDVPRGEEGNARQPLIQVVDEHVVHLQVGVALCRGEGGR